MSLQHSELTELDYDQRLKQIWRYSQRGLVYPAPEAIFSTFWLSAPVSRNKLKELMAELRTQIHQHAELKDANTSAILGVSSAQWRRICAEEGLSLPKGLVFNFPKQDNPAHSALFDGSTGAFQDSEGDLWFHIKSDKAKACELVLDFISESLASVTKFQISQNAASKSERQDGLKGKVLGCRFSENLNNPADPVSISKHCITGFDDIDHLGSSYVLAQRFIINWDQINTMSEDQIEDLIGRKTNDTIIPDRDTRSHIKSARMQDSLGNTTPVLRLGLPFGKASLVGQSSRSPKGATVADEQGIYFAGFTKSFAILENIMQNQIGAVAGFMNDRLFNHVKSDLGGFFYIPSLADLDLLNEPRYHSDFSALLQNDWSRFPGVDWSRLDRHFEEASPNGLMYYNHKNYLYKMATMPDQERLKYNPPSARVLSLLENIFSLWQDNWYINRKQQEIEHNIAYYLQQYQGEDKPADIWQESVMVRKGWAIRLTLHLLASADYGFRGRRVRLPDGSLAPFCGHANHRGEVVYGADTYRISAEEIIVGAMPNLSLGEGRYVMKYLTDQERQDGFLANLSEASGVGHVIPDYEQALLLGIDGMLQQIRHYQQSATSAAQRELYQSSLLALQGVSEYCLRYAALADQMAAQMNAGQQLEKHNLQQIAKRMQKLSKAKPDTFVEAVQFIFTLHTCLHLNGEPTALGRLDQLLQPFFDKDSISLQQAQEVIDAFYIKLDEKVQQNRIFMEDHQPFGNLAMGGSSGPYPQGASLGQWIQQLTVGGTVADGSAPFSATKAAYNDMTRLFIRASRRLPLNAPCLSLRTRKDIPQDLLEEAAMAILSGGAHPILLNDEKIIEGLYQSGDQVGGDLDSDPSGLWRSKVSLQSAQNYACDGCYEPQFPGENWFSLGGFSTLQPLECAINQGRTYSSAGQSYLYGQMISMTTKAPELIQSFDELLDLYFQHFELLNRKAINGQLMGYGANTAFCPSPLLNVLMKDCLAKGQDFYSGGTRYNVYGPCYIALGSTINSLYAIKKIVFDEKEAVTTLSELLECLCCDWGYKMTEPFISQLSGEGRIAARSDRFKRLRQTALALPKYGRGNPDVDELGNFVISRIADIAVETFTQPLAQTKATMKRLAQQFGSKDFPFGLQIQPGVGTFENHVEMGAWNGASADGRRVGTTVASDMSATPSPTDLAIDHQWAGFGEALAGFAGLGAEKMSDGAPTDFNIKEDFPLESLTAVLRQFADGQSSNILTVTVANPDTFSAAVTQPEKYDLLRVRTGGWTNFFTSVFPVIQQQHQRRPLSAPDAKCPFHKS